MNNEKPDIVIFMTDQWNARCLGYLGTPSVQTPNIDKLAEEGTAFSAAYTASPVCQPARASFSSGLYPHNHGFWSNYTGRRFPAEEMTMFRDLGGAGYRTAWIGKMHFFNHEFGGHYEDSREYYDQLGMDCAWELPTPFMGPMLRNEYTDHLKEKGLLKDYIKDISRRYEQGQFDTVDPNPLPPDDQSDGYIGIKAVEYVRGCPTDKPMFLCVSFPGPHTPFDAPGKYGAMFNPAKMVLDESVPTEIATQARELQANYYGKLAHLDDRIGDLVAALQERGNWANTVAVFTADHGEYLGRHNKWGKGSFHEESARIPMVFRWPGKFQEGVKTEALVEWLDVYPTLVEVAGGEMSPHRFGASLVPLLTGEEASAHDAVFSEIQGKDDKGDFMVRAPDFKWFVRSGVEHLFDMRSDPYELNNLADDPNYQGKVVELKLRLLEFLRATQVNYSAGYRNLFNRLGFDSADREGMAERLEALFTELHFGDREKVTRQLRQMGMSRRESPSRSEPQTEL